MSADLIHHNYPNIIGRATEFVRGCLAKPLDTVGASHSPAGCAWLMDLADAVGLERPLSELGISTKDHETILDVGFNPQHVKINPMRVGRADLAAILDHAR